MKKTLHKLLDAKILVDADRCLYTCVSM